jgi:pimeloyl-ACP methyl ester carboxylesterase
LISRIEQLEQRTLLSGVARVIAADGGSSIHRADPIGPVDGVTVIHDSLSRGESSDVFAFSVGGKGNVGVFLSGLKANGNIRLFDAAGKRISYSAHAKTRTESIYRTLAPGNYKVSVDRAKRAANTPFTLTVQADLNYESVNLDGRTFNLGITRADGAATPIVAGRDTWVLIHGWGSAPRHMQRLAAAIDAFSPTDQVLELDWSAAASASTDKSTVANRVPDVAAWAADKLADWGITGDHLNLVGHSFGGYMTDEIAQRMPGGVHRVIALDPAIPNAAGIDYAGHADFSLAVVTSSLANGAAAATADETIRLNSGDWNSVNTHSNIRDVFASLLERGNSSRPDAISSIFSVEHIFDDSPRPFEDNGVGGSYEAILTTRNLGGGKYAPTSLAYRDAFSGSPVTLSE